MQSLAVNMAFCIFTLHISVVHDKVKPFQCEKCGKKFSDKYSLEDHMRIKHEKEKMFMCHFCFGLFSTCSQLRGHLNGVHYKTKHANQTDKTI